MQVRRKDLKDKVVLQVKDSNNLRKNIIIGEAEIDLDTLCFDCMHRWVNIKYKGRGSGAVLLQTKWQPAGSKEESKATKDTEEKKSIVG